MAKSVKLEDLGGAIAEELTIYHRDATERVNLASAAAVKDLVQKTKATAPKGERGSFRKNISSKVLKTSNRGDTYVWYVKPPDHRLTHLLVHGHAKKDGGRTKANPFLSNALATVLPEYEKAVEEALK